MPNNLKEYCHTCGHIIAKSKVGISTISYRHIVENLATIQNLSDNKDKLVAIIRKASRVPDIAREFAQNLEEYLKKANQEVSEEITLPEVKKWLYEQLDIIPCSYSEKDLYEFLRTNYSQGINEPFAIFYDKFCSYRSGREGVMTKNLVSRALNAIGLRAKMTRIPVEHLIDGHQIFRFKSAMIYQATGEELRALLSAI